MFHQEITEPGESLFQQEQILAIKHETTGRYEKELQENERDVQNPIHRVYFLAKGT